MSIDNKVFLNPTIKRILLFCMAAYGFYSFYLLIEIFDFLAMLHTKEPDSSPTYNIVHVVYFNVEMIICAIIAILYLIFERTNISCKVLLNVCIVIILFRIIIIYYLYLSTGPEYRRVPYIYKRANEFSNRFRSFFLMAQLILGSIIIWYCWKFQKNAVDSKFQ